MIRQATASDLSKISGLVDTSARAGEILPRTLDDITKDLPTFFVATNRTRTILGACSLKIYSPELCEIRSLVVDGRHRGQDWGVRLLRRCVRRARKLGFRRAFALTYFPEFFQRVGFSVVEKMALPQKVWKDCIYCSRFKDCMEVAVLRDL